VNFPPFASFSVISVFAFTSVSEVKQSLSFKLELTRHSLLQLHALAWFQNICAIKLYGQRGIGLVWWCYKLCISPTVCRLRIYRSIYNLDFVLRYLSVVPCSFFYAKLGCLLLCLIEFFSQCFSRDQRAELTEITNVTRAVCQTHRLPLALT
jgi:hypothetical protein